MLKLHPANTLRAWYLLNFIFAFYLAALSSPDRASLPPCCSVSSSSISKPLVLAGVVGLYPHPAGCILVCYPRCRPWPSLLPCGVSQRGPASAWKRWADVISASARTLGQGSPQTLSHVAGCARTLWLDVSSSVFGKRSELGCQVEGAGIKPLPGPVFPLEAGRDGVGNIHPPVSTTEGRILFLRSL